MTFAAGPERMSRFAAGRATSAAAAIEQEQHQLSGILLQKTCWPCGGGPADVKQCEAVAGSDNTDSDIFKHEPAYET